MIGEHEPFISEEHVQAALETLVYTSSPRSIPAALQHLILVDEFLINPEFPPSARSREFAFQHILIKMIHSELSRHRLALGLSEPLENESLETTIAAISQDAQNGSKELIGWDLLYYRYVRVDLDIDSGLISDLTYIDERTLRRYRTHAIRRLTERLVKAEWEARSRLKKRRLYAQLPAASVDGALGREAILQRAFNALCEDLPIRICVSGPPGIGKSTFVQELLRRYIDKYDLDELVWINYPPSPTFVRHYLSEQLLPPTSSITLREYLLSYRVAVVLDEIESLLADNQALDELLDYLSPALICLTGHEHIMSSRVTLQIQLGELDYTASRDVVLSAMSIGDEAPDPETSDSLTTLLYDKVGGNPTALKLAARNFSIYDEEFITDGVVTRLFDHVFASLDDRVRRVWLMFALQPEGAVTLEKLAGLWPSWTTKDAVRVLLSRFLIEKTRTTKSAYRLGKAAREFIHQQLEGEPAKSLFMDLIEVIDRHMANDPEKVLATAEHVLLRKWFPVGQERRHRWITALAGHGVEQGRFAIWHAILDPIIQADDSATILYQIAYGVCLRHLSERDLAADRFRHAIRKAGDKGDFLQQGRALLELGVLYRLQGRYTRTQKLIAQAEQVAKRSKNRTLEELIRLERAQIAIDLSDGEEAKSLLRGLPESSRQLTLLSEANLIAGAFEQSRIQAERALKLLGNDQAAIGRLHTTIGRAYYREGKFEQALDQFTLSVALLEAQQDHFGLARAWSNLGALLMNEIETYDMAGKLLTQAEQTEAILGDRVALSATRHNLNLLRRYRS